jgi:PAS domain S-box-containing protein
MGEKSIYQELKKRVHDLEDIAPYRRHTVGDLLEAARKYRIHFSLAKDVIFTIDRTYTVTSVSPSVEGVLGYKPEELVGKSLAELTVVPPEYLEKALHEAQRILQGEKISSSTYQFITREGSVKYGEVSGEPYLHDGRSRAIISIARDITERMRFEEQLLAKEKELTRQAGHLEEMSIALKVLLDARDKEKKRAQELIMSRARMIIYPYLEMMEAGNLDEECRVYLNIIKANLADLLTPYINTLSQQYLNFTPMEMRIADLVRQGKSTKDIAGMMKVTPFAISFHRRNIRRKCGLLKAKKNLRTHLHAIEKE